MPKVWNKRDRKIPTNSVYVGRPTKWGNPYSHLPNSLAQHRVADRDAAVDAYEAALLRKFAQDPQAHARLCEELGGKDLVCWCAPLRCHGDVLLKYANQPPEDQQPSAK